MLRESDLTLEKAIQFCKAAEQAKKQVSELAAIPAELAVNAIGSANNSKRFVDRGNKKEQLDKFKCRKCGGTHAFTSSPRMNNLKLNKDKCQFGVTEVTFLGDRLTQNRVQPDVEKVIAIQEMPQPSSVKELHRFLGMVTYLARWIPDLSSVAAPLRILLNKNIQWMWDVQQEQAWLKLKTMLTLIG